MKEESISKIIDDISSKKKFEKNCAKGELCYLLLLNGAPEEKDKNAEFVSVLRKTMGDVM